MFINMSRIICIFCFETYLTPQLAYAIIGFERNSDMNNTVTDTNKPLFLRILQGVLVGTGAVLPGISGGVLCVVFGIYKPLMEFFGNPVKRFKTHAATLIPFVIGVVIGFLGVAKLLGYLLNKYPDPSVCLFIGLICGMFPALFREAKKQGQPKGCHIPMMISFAVILSLLIFLKVLSVEVTPNILWYMFCGFCLAISIIVPGMSFSTLLMPLGLYTPFVSALGGLKFDIIIPALIGVVLTVVCLSKGVDKLFEKHYAYAYYGIIGIVSAATIMIIPFKSFTVSVESAAANIICAAAGVIAALALDKFNSSVTKPD
jgi:putative membrane protein